MRISDWSSDVCSSDLRSPPASAPTGASSTRSSRAGLDPPPADAAGRRPALRLHGPPAATPGTGAQPVPGKRHAVHDPEPGRSTPAFALEQHGHTVRRPREPPDLPTTQITARRFVLLVAGLEIATFSALPGGNSDP